MVNNAESWWSACVAYRQPKVIAMLFLGFAAGLPFLLIFSTLTAWLRDTGVDIKVIGFFGWIGIFYSIKILWAPIIDSLALPWLTAKLGRRRSWLLLAQCSVALGLWFMSQLEPTMGLEQVVICALFVAFASATQDIALDAYRIEALVDEYQGAMAASYILGYRISLLVAGGGALYLADFYDWSIAYQTMAALMGVGVITTLLISEPAIKPTLSIAQSRSLSQQMLDWIIPAIIRPVTEFFHRFKRFAWVILLLIGCYRISDITMGIMANPFYLDLGFSKSTIASVVKIYGFTMTILGAFLGGLLVLRFGILRPLLLGACLAAVTNILFAGLAWLGADLPGLIVVISADNFSAGLATSAFMAYLASLTDRSYTATQYALFSSWMTLPGKFISGFSGLVVTQIGYVEFFLFTAVCGIPAIILVLVVSYRARVITSQ